MYRVLPLPYAMHLSRPISAPQGFSTGTMAAASSRTIFQTRARWAQVPEPLRLSVWLWDIRAVAWPCVTTTRAARRGCTGVTRHGTTRTTHVGGIS